MSRPYTTNIQARTGVTCIAWIPLVKAIPFRGTTPEQTLLAQSPNFPSVQIRSARSGQTRFNQVWKRAKKGSRARLWRLDLKMRVSEPVRSTGCRAAAAHARKGALMVNIQLLPMEATAQACSTRYRSIFCDFYVPMWQHISRSEHFIETEKQQG